MSIPGIATTPGKVNYAFGAVIRQEFTEDPEPTGLWHLFFGWQL